MTDTLIILIETFDNFTDNFSAVVSKR